MRINLMNAPQPLTHIESMIYLVEKWSNVTLEEQENLGSNVNSHGTRRHLLKQRSMSNKRDGSVTLLL